MCRRAAGAAHSRCSLSSRWLERSLPAYGSQAVAVLQLQLELLWARSGGLALYASQHCSSLLSWIRDGLPAFVDGVRRTPPLLQERRSAGVAAARGSLWG